MAAKPATNQGPWYRPSRIVWQLPWLGLAHALNTIVTTSIFVLVVYIADNSGASADILRGNIETGYDFILAALAAVSVLYGVASVLIALPILIYLAALAMAITTAVLLFISSTRASGRVALLYKSLPPSRFKLNIALWFSLVAFIVSHFVPPIPGASFFGSQEGGLRYARQTDDLIVNFYNFINSIDMVDTAVAVLSIAIPIAVSLGASLAFSYALFMFLFMTTLRPNSALLLKRIFYIFALTLATVAPLGIVPAPIGFRDSNLSFATSQLDLFNLLAPVFLLLVISLAWLYFQRARLAAFGARVKGRVRWIALIGVAVQAFYLFAWSVFSAPNLGADAEFFYVGSVLLAAFVAVAWFGLLLMVGARRKWDWALFGLVAAAQIASLIVVYPGLLAA